MQMRAESSRLFEVLGAMRGRSREECRARNQVWETPSPGGEGRRTTEGRSEGMALHPTLKPEVSPFSLLSLGFWPFHIWRCQGAASIQEGNVVGAGELGETQRCGHVFRHLESSPCTWLSESPTRPPCPWWISSSKMGENLPAHLPTSSCSPFLPLLPISSLLSSPSFPPDSDPLTCLFPSYLPDPPTPAVVTWMPRLLMATAPSTVLLSTTSSTASSCC